MTLQLFAIQSCQANVATVNNNNNNNNTSFERYDAYTATNVNIM